MAYISTQKVAEIRTKLKQEFPEIKFSVRKSSGAHAIEVSIMKAPYEFRPTHRQTESCMSINHYWLEDHGWNHIPILKRIIDICNEGNWNNSNAMIDYFDVGWYFNLNVGMWNKPFELAARLPKQSLQSSTFAGVPQCL